MTTRGLAVVTGASTGIGKAVAEHLAQTGFHVLAGVRTEAAAAAIAAEGIEPVSVDIADPDQIGALAQRVADDPRADRCGSWSTTPESRSTPRSR